ncbi:PAS domain-containing hybrid sensor histidine kinase/response regulator [Salidesulfovibrio brasiliensis]|uniref:PAS domain-containing hybrid sensor histidine kinase/response regulator n=1 Tax=Salidesulfovibrio brasiliensis TaxID=221711 RepID=UPI000B195A80|nr:PAS domain-containing hybrid sensor histidine kinase/response regulator [Salidesulfovibrio brasiliensis]
MAVCSQDLTPLRQTDEDLRREQQRQIFFMESLPGLVFHIYRDNTIRYANRYFRKLFGSPKGQPCNELLKCNGSDCSICPPKDAMDNDKALEKDWTAPNGRTFHVQYSPMTDSSGERMVMALGIDITARKEAEDALLKARDELEDRVRQRTKELQRANSQLRAKSINLVKAKKRADAAAQAKSKFLANMSHEVRTPLNAIIGMTELAIGSGNDEDRREYLDNVLEASTSLLSVLNDILDFSKIEAQKLSLESLDFDPRKVVGSALDMYRPTAEEKGLELFCEVDEDVPATLRGDPSRLRQILLNLLGNAIKFTAKGSVGIRAENADPEDHRHILRFSVTDTGIGIPEDKQQAIFESFLQADDSVTRKHGGTGLGLAISRLLVDLMDGQMTISSREGEGSTFAFTAAFDKASGEEVCHDEEPLPELPKLNILLADDNRLNRQLAATVLKERGHDITSAENGQEVLDLLRAAKFDLVLMDVQMPVMDGVSATRAIRTPGSGVLDPNIPVVAITAHALKGDRERFLETGMNAYVSKPIRVNDLVRAIASAYFGREGREASARKVLAGEEQTFDRETALSLLDGRVELLSMMDGIFLRDTPKDLSALEGALDSGDLETAKRHAHSIKGSSRTVGAVKAGSIAEQLEYQCGKGEKQAAFDSFASLKAEVETALKLIGAEQDGLQGGEDEDNSGG